MPICQICNLREATLFITRTVNGQKSQLSVCRQCAAESGIVKIDLNNLLAGLAAFSTREENPEEETVATCPICGMTLEEFNKTGRMGCSQCYRTFEEPMEQLFSRIHGHVRHTGKRPKSLPVPEPSPELEGRGVSRAKASPASETVSEAGGAEPTEGMGEMERLRAELAEAIRAEAYEQAAVLRDRIRALEHVREGQS